jgi:Tfp pilus assembly protein PilV
VRRLTSRLDSDEGLSLVETIAALLVFALIMSGLAAGMALYAHTTALTKAKNAATSVAQ